MITREDIENLVMAASNAGYQVNVDDLQLLTWNAGVDTHIPIALPNGFSAVYFFKHEEIFLKVGMASGANANPRYQSQHYYINAPSTLSRSLLNDPVYSQIIEGQIPRDWIITNTKRYNILIPDNYNKHFVNFTEAYFILKCNPRFEK
jgi:hypothetical protein